MRAMTEALYNRIDAIEQFAADVAHEIKNPLTSLKSAVETLRRATPEQAARLLSVIEQDVGRVNRLVTDISDASRLDAELSRPRPSRPISSRSPTPSPRSMPAPRPTARKARLRLCASPSKPDQGSLKGGFTVRVLKVPWARCCGI